MTPAETGIEEDFPPLLDDGNGQAGVAEHDPRTDGSDSAGLLIRFIIGECWHDQSHQRRHLLFPEREHKIVRERKPAVHNSAYGYPTLFGDPSFLREQGD